MDKKAQARFKKHLLQNQSDLQATTITGDETVELDQSRVGRLSRIDAMQEQAMSVERKRRHNMELKKIASALQRIEEDEYGYCLHCGEDIAIKRLELDPAASLCIDCANKAEKI